MSCPALVRFPGINNLMNVRQHSVIIDVVPIVTRGVGKGQSLQPLDTPASDLTWYNGSEGAAVIRPESLSIHLMRKHDPPVRVHGPIQFNGCSIVAVRLHKLASYPIIILAVQRARELTSLSAPSMHRYLAFRSGFAAFNTSAIIGPVNNAVERPAGPHEKPFDFRTMFCSFRRFPAQTRVMGAVTWSNCFRIPRKWRVRGFSTSLGQLVSNLM